MNKQKSRERRGLKTKALIRKIGKSRLVVYRSNDHIYSQIVCSNNAQGDIVLVSCSTKDKEIISGLAGKCKVDQAKAVGQMLGERANKINITEIAFDRSGYKYHGRVKALAEGAREAGLKF